MPPLGPIGFVNGSKSRDRQTGTTQKHCRSSGQFLQTEVGAGSWEHWVPLNVSEGPLKELIMTNHIDHMKSLHTTVIDARNGYEEALQDAEGKGLSPLFQEMIALHQAHANALAKDLAKHGQTIDNEGSFLSTIHRTVISVRSLFGGLDESILPGLIDGEERVLGYYDDALTDCPPSEAGTLAKQRDALQAKVDEMKARKRIPA